LQNIYTDNATAVMASVESFFSFRLMGDIQFGLSTEQEKLTICEWCYLLFIRKRDGIRS